MLSVNYAECHKQAHYAECRYAECRYAECRRALSPLSNIYEQVAGTHPNVVTYQTPL